MFDVAIHDAGRLDRDLGICAWQESA